MTESSKITKRALRETKGACNKLMPTSASCARSPDKAFGSIVRTGAGKPNKRGDRTQATARTSTPSPYTTLFLSAAGAGIARVCVLINEARRQLQADQHP